MKKYPCIAPVVFCLIYLTGVACYGQEKPIDSKLLSSSKQIHTGQEVFDRLNRSFKPLQCNDKSAHIWLKTYTRHKDFSAHLANSLPLLDYVSREFEQAKLPSEYSLVPFIESHYNPAARSKIGPGGLWQMITTTAQHLGVKVNAHYDGRYSPVDSTQGALKYFNELSKNFSGWQTILMAYNTGGSRMRSSLKKQGLKSANIQKKLPAGLDSHTYTYVLKIQAIACLISEPERYRFVLPTTVEFTPLVVVKLGPEFASIEAIEKKLNIKRQALIELNPSYKNLRYNSSNPGLLLVPRKDIAD
jgi:membrane-bound lytic murein transglycosylase D